MAPGLAFPEGFAVSVAAGPSVPGEFPTQPGALPFEPMTPTPSSGPIPHAWPPGGPEQLTSHTSCHADIHEPTTSAWNPPRRASKSAWTWAGAVAYSEQRKGGDGRQGGDKPCASRGARTHAFPPFRRVDIDPSALPIAPRRPRRACPQPAQAAPLPSPDKQHEATSPRNSCHRGDWWIRRSLARERATTVSGHTTSATRVRPIPRPPCAGWTKKRNISQSAGWAAASSTTLSTPSTAPMRAFGGARSWTRSGMQLRVEM